MTDKDMVTVKCVKCRKEYQIRFKNYKNGMTNSNAIIIGKTEVMFSEDTQKLPSIDRIEYTQQYRNQIKHPDFNTIFPVNPITNGSVNPYHIWDFIIYGKYKNILIDIDGSIHYKKKNNYYFKNSKGDKINLSELMTFNESQRYYQTDGLDAYVIQCYDDKLSDDTSVLDLKSGKKIKYKDLLNIILYLNIDDAVTKEII